MPDFEDPEKNSASEGARIAWLRLRAEQIKANWKVIAWTGGVAAAASIVTLTVTHNSAVAENAKAYDNGRTDGFAANVRAFLAGYGECLEDNDFDDWY